MVNLSLKAFLLSKGVIDSKTLEDAYQTSQKNGSLLYNELMRLKVISEKELFKLLAEFFGMEYRFEQLSELKFDLIKKFPLDKLEEYKALPLFEDGNTIFFAVSNPFRVEEVKEFSKYTGKHIQCALIEPTQMDLLLRYTDNKILQVNALNDFISNDSTSDITSTADGQYIVEAPIIKLCVPPELLNAAITVL